MSRTIKFRAWVNGRMRTDCLIVNSDCEVSVSVHQLEAEGVYIGTYDELPVMQYTGLKDKNGVEIYEGDICEYNAGISPNSTLVFKVVWDNSKARFGENQAISIHDGSFLRASAKVAIIGNIHQNPDIISTNT